MLAQKTYHNVKTARVRNNINKASNSAFTVNVHCVYPRLHHQLSVVLETYRVPALAFCSQTRDKLTLRRLSSTCPNFVVLVMTRKILNNIIVLEIYVTRDIISSNLVLIVLTLYRLAVQTFLNAQ